MTTYHLTCHAGHPECTDGICGWCDAGVDACDCVCAHCKGVVHITSPDETAAGCACGSPADPFSGDAYRALVERLADRL